RALESERLLFERTLPQLRELDTVPWSVEKARAFADELQTKLFHYADFRAPDFLGIGGRGRDAQDWHLKLSMTLMVAQAYPEAKRALIAQGRSAAQVEAMPAIQAAALHAYQIYQAYRDDIFKWGGLPYHQAYQGMRAWRRQNA